MTTPLQIWLEKKLYLEQQLASNANASQKFDLREQIKECDKEIARLQSQTTQNTQPIESNAGDSQTNNPLNPMQNNQANNTISEQEQPIIAFRQGAISTMTVAFILISGLKQVGGLESVELLAKLHSAIKSFINKQNYQGIQVLSSLLGAIVLLPDSLQLNTINLIISINNEMNSLGIPIRVGMSRGDIQELLDVDGKANFIGVAINHSARLATSNLTTHPGLLVHDSLASHLQSTLRASHWLSARNSNRLFIEVEGKRDEKFLCFYPSESIWPTLSTVTYPYDEEFQPISKNAAIIAYDLPNFSDGDLNQLSQRFRAITDVFLTLVTNTKLPLKYFYFSPGGDGGVLVFTDLDKKPVYDLAKNFAERLLIESQNKSSLISAECRIGLHYGTILLYENAQGYLRPTGEDIFIADDLMADKDIKKLGSFVFTEEFKSAVSGGDDRFFFQIFQSVPALSFLSRNISRYVFKPTTPKLSCSDYLASLSQTDLYYWIKLNLSPKQIEQVWFALFNDPIGKDIKNNHISHCIIELCNKVQENLLSSDLHKELSKQSQEPYQILPTDNKRVLDLIEQAGKENLTILDLSCQSLKNLPEQLFTLIEIERLYLAGNELTDLPEEIPSLSKLEYLDLYKNQLTSLTEKFGELNTLKYLDLSYNKLTTLPSEFGKLTNIYYLDISYNKLVTVPQEFGNLNNLDSLNISYNELNQIPNEFGNLNKLKSLDLSYNRLNELPSGFGQLTNLQSLYLSHNQLTQLPSQFGGLVNLESLYLSSNQLTHLPSQFGRLANLQFLYLSHNQLTQLPNEFGQLNNLKRLNIKENKQELERTIPPEILALENTPQKIISFLNQTVKNTLNEAKMLVVGEPDIGKTSLVKRLVHNSFDPKEPMTKGIEIEKGWSVNTTNGKQIKVNIWDFGGQEIMHATHQFFLTKRSLYLLVLHGRRDEQQNRLDYWLKTIRQFAGDAPIIVVVNQIDIEVLELERRKLKTKYNIKAFLETSCQTGEGIDSLKKKIVEEINLLPFIDTLLPQTWFLVKNQLEDAQKQKDYLDYKNYEEICQDQGLDQQSQETLIDFLHDLGVVLCFYKDLRVPSTHILNPKWVTDAVYKILNDDGLSASKGILKISDLDKILKLTEYTREHQKFIIAMMRKFELCLDLGDPNQGNLLIPDLLPKDPTELGDWQDSLKFQYHYDFLPSSIISRFIVRVSPHIHDKIYWRYGVVIEFRDKPNKALVKADLEARKIFVSINGVDSTKAELLYLVRVEFDNIHASIPGLQVNEKIPIPKYPSIVTDYKHLLVLKEKKVIHFIPEGYDQLVSVDELLGVIETKPTLPDNINVSDNISDNISDVVLQIRKNVFAQITDVVSPNIISEITTKFNQPKTVITATKPVHILHLSDIHLGTIEQGNIYYNQLQLDLTKNLKLATLNYLIISGDIANKSTKDEYEAAFNLINQIKGNFGLKDKQVIVTPGNHDLNWDLSEEAYSYVPKRKLPSILTDAYIPIETGALLRDEEEYKKRFDNFSEFYREVTGNAYPSNYEDQAILHTFTQDRLLVLALNSAWQIDHHYTKRASINQVALGKALNNVNSSNYQDWLKIAIWHHPISGQEMMNADFVEQLAVAEIELCLHGHIHQAIEGFHKYDDNRSLAIIGGGTFGAPAKAQVTGIPLQYNLLELDPSPSKATLTVKSRKKEKVDEAWSADARWGDKEEPKAFYTIKLKHSLQQQPKLVDIPTSPFEFDTVKVDAKGEIKERNKKRAKQFIEELGNGVQLEMVEIPGGSFMMGTSPDDIEKVVAEYKRYDRSEEQARRWVVWETPQHKVTIPAFYIGKYQITQAQWKEIIGNNPSNFKGNDNLPVKTISWDEVIEFCKKLSEKTSKTYRLPSEAEWEYACRAGSNTAFAFGETINPEIVNYDGNRPYGEAPKGEYRQKTIPVGSLGVANEFGLYDMHGNVWEWCQDHWHNDYADAPTDGSAWEISPSNNTSRVLRGGSYYFNAYYCRSAVRYWFAPDKRIDNFGFRVVMSARTLK